MKRKFVMVLALTSIFSSVTPVFAKTDKEILFRDIPWGTSFSDTKDLFPDQCLFGMQLDGINAMSTKEILTGMSDDSNVYDGKICLYAQPLDIADVDVAGYSTPYLNFYYSYSINENKIDFDDSNTLLYGAQYEFEPQDIDSMYSDLLEKLSSVYGNPDKTESDTTQWGIKNIYTWWYGANNTSLVLRASDLSDYDDDLENNKIYISYAWQKGDELLKTADDTISQSNSDTEASVYGNGSTNGL